MVSEHNQGTICKDRSWGLLNCVFWGKNQTDFQAQKPISMSLKSQCA